MGTDPVIAAHHCYSCWGWSLTLHDWLGYDHDHYLQIGFMRFLCDLIDIIWRNLGLSNLSVVWLVYAGYCSSQGVLQGTWSWPQCTFQLTFSLSDCNDVHRSDMKFCPQECIGNRIDISHIDCHSSFVVLNNVLIECGWNQLPHPRVCQNSIVEYWRCSFKLSASLKLCQLLSGGLNMGIFKCSVIQLNMKFWTNRTICNAFVHLKPACY
jgi:hypothetical protein